MRLLSVVLHLAIGTCFLYAQKIKTVSGEYTYYAPETVSMTEAKRYALEQAKIEALASEFGTIVTQSNATSITNINGEGGSKFQSLSSSDVKGEWIENIGEPTFIISQGDHLTAITCKIKGKAREIKGSRIQYEYAPLKNGKDKRFIDTNFRDGDELFLYFSSPVDGYLCVFLLDEVNQTVYSVLPYRQDRNSSYYIERDKDYILFSLDDAPNDMKNIVDEYILSCEEDREYNTLYILFSPDRIYKGKGYKTDIAEVPDNIPFTEFRTRLGKLLANNPDIQFSQVSISISK